MVWGVFMESWMLGAIIGVAVSLLAAVLIRLEMCHKSLINVLERSGGELRAAIGEKSTLTVADSVIELIQSEISAAIQDVAGNMRVPTAIDHLAGVAANIMQMREQWKIQKEAAEMNANPLITAADPAGDYGTP
jgi:hypothetical protein